MSFISFTQMTYLVLSKLLRWILTMEESKGHFYSTFISIVFQQYIQRSNKNNQPMHKMRTLQFSGAFTLRTKKHFIPRIHLIDTMSEICESLVFLTLDNDNVHLLCMGILILIIRSSYYKIIHWVYIYIYCVYLLSVYTYIYILI